MTAPSLVPVAWPAPANVAAFSSTRIGGVSEGPFASLNLAAGLGDAPDRVARNVARLAEAAGTPCAPRWPRQVHGTAVVEARALEAGYLAGGAPPRADVVFTSARGAVCSVRTADCLPVLLCDRAGSAVAAVHAGWRGLAAGVLEAAVAAFPVPADTLMAWLGPAIGPAVYEVGSEVRERFLGADREAEPAFRPSPAGRWLADLYALARRRLTRAGVEPVHGGDFCTLSDAERFFSYRRDGVTGRMASGIWLR